MEVFWSVGLGASHGTIFKHIRSPSSLTCCWSGFCTTQTQPEGLWSGHWNCQALVSGLKALQQFRAEPWRSSLQNGPQRLTRRFKKPLSPARKRAETGLCILMGPSHCKAPVMVCCLSHPPESTSSMLSKHTFPERCQLTIPSGTRDCLPVLGSQRTLESKSSSWVIRRSSSGR